MEESFDQIAAAAAKSQEQATRLFERLMEVAQPESVYSEPLTSGELTVITASEVTTGLGFGFGVGAGTGMSPDSPKESKEPATMGQGSGGGGGGGGGSIARPVAVITISPQGVRVEPVVDATKLGLALFVTVGSMFMMLSRMWRMSRG